MPLEFWRIWQKKSFDEIPTLNEINHSASDFVTNRPIILYVMHLEFCTKDLTTLRKLHPASYSHKTTNQLHSAGMQIQRVDEMNHRHPVSWIETVNEIQPPASGILNKTANKIQPAASCIRHPASRTRALSSLTHRYPAFRIKDLTTFTNTASCIRHPNAKKSPPILSMT